MNKFLTLTDLLLLALDALKKNRLRTVLSVFGIVIGISTLILVLGISNAAQGFIRDQLASFGTDTVFIEVKVPDADEATSGAALATGVQIQTMKVSDVVGVRKIPNVKDSYGAVLGQEKAVYRENARTGIIFGTMASFVNIDASKVSEGRFFTQAEDDSLARVAVIGQTVKKDLFGSEDPLGKNIRIKNVSFKVIGVMEERGAAFFQNYDEYIYLPLKTEQKLLLGYDHLPYFVVQVNDSDQMSVTGDDVKRFLRREHGIQGNDPKKDDFAVSTSEESLASIAVVFGAVSLLFGAIASISLVVGGVGIMNIMYVSVTERIREIGLRKAIGARRRDILLQFLLEALAITMLGGLLGILFGLFLTFIISFGASFAGIKLDMSLSPAGFILGLVVTTLFGVVFGFGPARKAAGMQPIEALRAD